MWILWYGHLLQGLRHLGQAVSVVIVLLKWCWAHSSHQDLEPGMLLSYLTWPKAQLTNAAIHCRAICSPDPQIFPTRHAAHLGALATYTIRVDVLKKRQTGSVLVGDHGALFSEGEGECASVAPSEGEVGRVQMGRAEAKISITGGAAAGRRKNGVRRCRLRAA